MNEIIIKHGVHTLGRHFVISDLHILGLVLVVHGLESTIILHDGLSVRLFLRCILIVVSF